ncbi:MAG: helix-turn-helix transcriptional regulator [Blautia sp.]|nr:helix-turn-helix transcriptional regulator [Blautia sp.]
MPVSHSKAFHCHSHYEIIYTRSENLFYHTEADITPIPANSLVLINTMALHYIGYADEKGPYDRYVLYFDADQILRMNSPEVNLLDCFIRHKGNKNFLAVPDSLRPQIISTLEQMVSIQNETDSLSASDNTSRPAMNHLLLQLELARLLVLINRLFQERFGTPSSLSYQNHSQTVTAICRYIDEHYSEVLSVDQIAKRFLLSRTQLYNVFKEVLGISVTDYLSHVRITQAKSMLINTDYSVEIISQKAGYSNICSFSRAFKARVGNGPLQYRRSQLSRQK